MASHALRKASHALAEEGELLNVYSELKDIANAYDHRCKLQERAVKTLVQWTQRRKEDARIQELVASLGDLDIEASGVDRRCVARIGAFPNGRLGRCNAWLRVCQCTAAASR